ncbi:ABC transporter substrate-binding protein [Brevibacillus centrosporus]|uniref:ABC transporter substrate-binding protein n=1 Tax=Brevibacillus centrosporus TaxID=54910 RepID=UPI002E1C4D2F|nr:extracellular solute-binding protein [Brevibacillus centrosporus]
MKKAAFKLISSLLMIPLLGMALGGCGGNSGASPAQTQTQTQTSTAPAGESALQGEVAKIYEAAKKEGKLVLWSPTDVAQIQKMKEDFNKVYPGIEVEHFEIQPGEAVEKIITESSAGQVNVDVADFPLAYLPQLINRGLIEKYDYEGVFGLKSLRFDSQAVDIYHLSVPISYNKNLVSEEDVPKSWDDLLLPKWKGKKIILESRGIAFSILSQEWGEQKTLEFLDKILAQDPIIVKGGTPTLQSLANGEGAIAIGTYAYKVDELQKKGAPVDFANVGPVPAMGYAAGVLKKSPHPNAALLFASWLGSKEGLLSRERTSGAGMLVNNETITAIGKRFAEHNTKIVVEDEKSIDTNSKILEEVGKRISSLK